MLLCLFRFISMKLRSVTFIDSTFRNCFFDDVTSVGSSFRNCTFIDAFFFNTGEALELKTLELLLSHDHTAWAACFVISDSQIHQGKLMNWQTKSQKTLWKTVIWSVLLLPNCDLLYSLGRHRWIQVDRWHGGDQQHIHPQQDGMPDDVWWRLQCLLGLLYQFSGNSGCSARQHCVRPSHGQNWASVHVR